MKRHSALRILNPILALLLLNQIIVGLFHLSLPHNAFEILHQGGGIILAAAALLHVILNWNWVKVNFIIRNKKT
jgi:protein-S-isoprenylcysteine O-methyltransferase Ste14